MDYPQGMLRPKVIIYEGHQVIIRAHKRSSLGVDYYGLSLTVRQIAQNK